MTNKYTTNALTLQGENKIRLSQLNAMVKDEDLMRALGTLYDAKELKVLTDIRTQANILDRINQVQRTAGSATQPIKQQQDEVQTVLASLAGLDLVQRPGLFKVKDWALNKFGLDPVQNVEKIILQAMVDPELAKTLLLKNVPGNEKIIKRRLNTYLANNFAQELKGGPADEDTQTGESP